MLRLQRNQLSLTKVYALLTATPPPVANGRLTADNRFEFHVTQLLWVRDQTSSAPVGHYPVHNYNFDLASLAVPSCTVLDRHLLRVRNGDG